MAERHGWLVRRPFVRLNRFGLHREILRPARQAVFVGSAIGDWRGEEISVWRRRRRGPLQGGRFPRIDPDLLTVPNAPEEIDDERNLRDAHRPGSDRDRQVPVETA